MTDKYTVEYGKDSDTWYVGIMCNGTAVAPYKRGISNGIVARREALWLKSFYAADRVVRRDIATPFFKHVNAVGVEHAVTIWQSDADRYAAQGCRIVVEKINGTWFVSMRDGKGKGNIYRWSCQNYQDATKLGNWSSAKIGTVAIKKRA